MSYNKCYIQQPPAQICDYEREINRTSQFLKEKESDLFEKEAALIMRETLLLQREDALAKLTTKLNTDIEKQKDDLVQELADRKAEADREIEQLKSYLAVCVSRRKYLDQLNESVPSNVRNIVDSYGFFNIVDMFRAILGGDTPQAYINKFTRGLNFESDSSVVKHKYTRIFSTTGPKTFNLPTYFETLLCPIYEKAVLYTEKHPTEVFHLSTSSTVLKELVEVSDPDLQNQTENSVYDHILEEAAANLDETQTEKEMFTQRVSVPEVD
jgi:hypothetical protein